MHSMAMLWNGGAGVCRGLCRYLSLFRMCTSVRGKWLRGLATNHRGHSREHGPTDDARACQRISSDLGGALHGQAVLSMAKLWKGGAAEKMSIVQSDVQPAASLELSGSDLGGRRAPGRRLRSAFQANQLDAYFG